MLLNVPSELRNWTDPLIILKWIFKKWDEGMEWIDLVLDRDRWWALLNVVMNLWVP
jgi:hypothetical protein